jgi:hypothetical protein
LVCSRDQRQLVKEAEMELTMRLNALAAVISFVFIASIVLGMV